MADDHNMFHDVPELMTWTEFLVLTLIYMWMLNHMEGMGEDNALIDSCIDEGFDDNSANIRPTQRFATVKNLPVKLWRLILPSCSSHG